MIPISTELESDAAAGDSNSMGLPANGGDDGDDGDRRGHAGPTRFHRERGLKPLSPLRWELAPAAEAVPVLTALAIVPVLVQAPT